MKGCWVDGWDERIEGGEDGRVGGVSKAFNTAFNTAYTPSSGCICMGMFGEFSFYVNRLLSYLGMLRLPSTRQVSECEEASSVYSLEYEVESSKTPRPFWNPRLQVIRPYHPANKRNIARLVSDLMQLNNWTPHAYAQPQGVLNTTSCDLPPLFLRHSQSRA